MVRLSLQIHGKDNFFPIIRTFGIDLNEDTIPDNVSQENQLVELGSVASTAKVGWWTGVQYKRAMPNSPVTLLLLLGSVLSNPNADVTEKGSALEMIFGSQCMTPVSFVTAVWSFT